MSCLICERDVDEGNGDKAVRVSEKGLNTLIKFSEEREDNLAQVFRSTPLPLLLHELCRKKYTRPISYKRPKDKKVEILKESLRPLNKGRANKRQIEESTDADFALVSVKEDDCKDFLPENFVETKLETEPTVTCINVKTEVTENEETIDSSAEGNDLEEYDPSQPFPFKDRCLICTKDISAAYVRKEKKKKLKLRNMVKRARKYSNRVLTRVLMKYRTPERDAILQRFQDVDLLAVKAGWHNMCIRSLNRLNRISGTRSVGKGKPIDSDVKAAMDKIYKYIDGSSKEEFTIREFKKIINNEYSIDNKTIKRHLQKKYGDRLMQTKYEKILFITRVAVPENNECNSAKDWRIMATHSQSVMTSEDFGENSEMKVDEDKGVMEADQTGRDDYDDDDYLLPEQEEPEQQQMRQIIVEVGNNTGPEKESSKYKLHCTLCLTVDRKVEELGEYEEIYRKICWDIDSRYPKLKLICWECRALLRNAKRLYERAHRAQEVMSQVASQGDAPTSLSTLSVNFPAKAKTSYTPNKSDHPSHEFKTSQYRDQKKNYKSKQSHMEGYENKYDDINDDDHEFTPSSKKQRQLVVEDDERYKNTDDVDITISTGTVKIETNIENEGVDYEENETGDLPDTTDYIHDTFSDASEDETDIRRDRNRRKSAKKKSYVDTDSPAEEDSSSDEDWDIKDYYKDTRPKRPEPERLVKNKHYVEVVLELNVNENRTIEPIERGDLEYWLEKERNSTYFRIQSSKCERCVCGVPRGEDHHKLFHSPQNPFLCEVCSCTFGSERELACHSSRHYYTRRCALCGFRCYTEEHIQDHLRSRHNTAIRCLQCEAEFRTVSIFKEHYEDLHRYCICDYCGKQLPNKIIIEKHIMLRHYQHTTKLECPICEKIYKKWQALERHKRIEHEVSRPEVAYCVQCDIQFANRTKYHKHVYHSREHAHEWKRRKPPPIKKPKPKQSVQCPACPKVYACERSYREHYELVHDNKITFQCHVCNMAFPRKSSLENHVRYVHEGFKLPKDKFCDICGRGFQTNRILTHHIRTHTGERPHACPHCDAKFAQKAAMTSHVKNIHLKKQQFERPVPFP